MNYFDINNIKPVDSAILALKNYLIYLYENDENVRKSIRNVAKFRDDLINIKEKLELDKHIRSIAYARQMKEFGLIADMLNIEYDKIMYNFDKLPVFACLNNSKNEEVYVLVFDITDDGILTKDNENNTRFISVSDFKKAYKNRLFFISDYSPLKKKYYVRDRDLNSYMVNNLFEFNGLSGEDVADLICAILECINF